MNVLLHDQGREFNNKLVNDLCALMNTDVAMTSAYHPQSNGLTERANQTLITHLMKVVSDKADDWDEHVAPVVFIYRVNKQASAKFSPFELLYGVKARLPINLEGEVPPDINDSDHQTAVDQRVVDLGQRLKETREEARENIKAAQSKQKARYDIKHSGPEYAVGQLVMKYNRRRETRMGDKLGQRFTGPFTIHEVLGKGVYRLRDGETVMKQMMIF